MVFGLFKKRIEPHLLSQAAAAAKTRFEDSLRAGCSMYCKKRSEIDETIRGSIEAQLMVLAILRPTLNFALQDAYMDAGKILFFEPLPAKLTITEERQALREVVADLPTSRSNLDMRYRYMFVNDVSSPGEDALWDEMVITSQPIVRRAFEEKERIQPFWVEVIARLSEHDADGAIQALAAAR